MTILDPSPVVPVVVLDDVETAVPVARALVQGGIRVIELTLRTPVALAAIERIASEVPEIVVGAGTVIDADQAKAAAVAGAQFLVSPGSTPALLDAITDTGLPLLPGCATISEVMALRERGITEVKFFPARGRGSGIPDLRPRAAARCPVLPYRWHHRRQRAGLPGPAERGLRRRLLAHAGRRRTGRRLGAHHCARICSARTRGWPVTVVRCGAQSPHQVRPGRLQLAAKSTSAVSTVPAVRPGARWYLQ